MCPACLVPWFAPHRNQLAGLGMLTDVGVVPGVRNEIYHNGFINLSISSYVSFRHERFSLSHNSVPHFSSRDSSLAVRLNS
jgi:hypothetical protein